MQRCHSKVVRKCVTDVQTESMRKQIQSIMETSELSTITEICKIQQQNRRGEAIH